MAVIFHDDCSSIANWEPNSSSEVISSGGSIYFHKTSGPYVPGGHFTIYPGKEYTIRTDDDFYARYQVHFAVPSPGRIEDLNFDITFAQLIGTGAITLSVAAMSNSSPGNYVGKVLVNSFGSIISSGYAIDLNNPATLELQSRIDGDNKYIDLTYNGNLIQSYKANTAQNILLTPWVTADQTDNTGDIVFYIDDVYFEWTPIPATSVQLSEHNITLIKYQSQNLDVTIEPEDYYGTGNVVSSDESVAQGLIFGYGVGEADVTFELTTIDPDTGEDVILTDVCHVTVLTNQLDTPDKPVWDNETLNWNEIEKAVDYTINLYVESTEYTGLDRSVTAETNSYDLNEELESLYTSGLTNLIVTATVIANGDYDPYYPSEESEVSVAFTPTSLPQVKQPTWADYKLTWEDVENASSYIVKLYNAAGGIVSTQTIAPGVKIADFSSVLSAGSFTATVQASEVVLDE